MPTSAPALAATKIGQFGLGCGDRNCKLEPERGDHAQDRQRGRVDTQIAELIGRVEPRQGRRQQHAGRLSQHRPGQHEDHVGREAVHGEFVPPSDRHQRCRQPVQAGVPIGAIDGVVALQHRPRQQQQPTSHHNRHPAPDRWGAWPIPWCRCHYLRWSGATEDRQGRNQVIRDSMRIYGGICCASISSTHMPCHLSLFLPSLGRQTPGTA